MLNDASVSHPLTILTVVFVGGFLGGLTRWALTRALPRHTATWAANMIGASVAGFAVTLPGLWQVAVTAGFAGAVSTFSTLAKELGELLNARRWADATKYFAATAFFGVAAASFGMIWGYPA